MIMSALRPSSRGVEVGGRPCTTDVTCFEFTGDNLVPGNNSRIVSRRHCLKFVIKSNTCLHETINQQTINLFKNKKILREELATYPFRNSVMLTLGDLCPIPTTGHLPITEIMLTSGEYRPL